MSIPHIFFATSGSSESTGAPINPRRACNSIGTTKENIRERLNMHVKKRIRELDVVAQYPITAPMASPFFPSGTPLSSALNSTHPLLIAGGPRNMAPMMVFGNSLIQVAPEFSCANERTLPMQIIDRKSPKINPNAKSITKKKKTAANKKAMKHIDCIQQAENLIINTKYSDESNEFPERNDMSNSYSDSISPPNRNHPDVSPISYEKVDQRATTTPDILSMVLSMKKNALMHDPYVIQFISSIR